MNTEDSIPACANCGKGEENSGDLKACKACKLVKYCNRECQIAHRPLHKEACKKRVAELHDDALFRDPPPPEDCSVCCIPMPPDATQTIFKPCCGKIICYGCSYAMREEARGRGKIDLCAFCRAPPVTSDEEHMKRTNKLIEADNVNGYLKLAQYYTNGEMGMPQDFAKADELLLRAGELGCANAYFNLGTSYYTGRGKEMDKKKSKYYWELAAMGGSVHARHNLGCEERIAGNNHRAMKHFIIAARAGYKDSLDNVRIGFKRGYVTTDEYANTLRAYQQRHDEMKSDDRSEAYLKYRS